MNRALASTTFLVFLGMPVFLLATDELSALLFLLVIGVSISVFPIVSVLILTGIFQVYLAVGLWLGFLRPLGVLDQSQFDFANGLEVFVQLVAIERADFSFEGLRIGEHHIEDTPFRA